jgi:uncharacterized membrane protein
MAKDLGDVIGHAVGRMARETVESVSTNARKASRSPLSGPKGLAAGAGLVALAPLAAKGAGELVKHRLGNGSGPVKKARDAVGGTVKDAVGKKIDEAGGAAGIAKQAGKGLLPGGGGGGTSSGSASVGSSRRMPIQQAVDVAVPIDTAYNQWTQFEEWPRFMHRLDRVTQDDETHVSFKTKIWGISKEFTAEIVDQRPDERIKWRVTDGVSHTGVVTFHKLSDRLTRVDVDLYVQPGSLIEKAGRGMRHVKRAVRADLARFKAYIELEDEETGAWRGAIDEGKVKSAQRGRSSSRSARSRSGSGRTKAASTGGRSRAAGSGGSSRSRSKSGAGSSNGGSASSSASNRRSSSSNGSSGSRSGARKKTASRS